MAELDQDTLNHSTEDSNVIDVDAVATSDRESSPDDSPSVTESETVTTSAPKRKIGVIAGVAAIAVVACVVLAVVFFVGLSGDKMPDLIGEKPYQARIELAKVIDDSRFKFINQNDFDAFPEKDSDYSNWVVAEQSVSAGSSIADDETITITITPSVEFLDQRKKIMEDFISSQITNYGWKKDEITWFDSGDVMMVQFSKYNGYGPLDYSYSLKGAQVEADQLASALGSDVVDVGLHDGYLEFIVYGMNSTSPMSAHNVAISMIADINKMGIDSASTTKNRIQALDAMKNGWASVGITASYRINDGGVIAIWLMSPFFYIGADFSSEDATLESFAQEYARELQAYVGLFITTSDGTIIDKHYADPTSFIYDKNTGDYRK